MSVFTLVHRALPFPWKRRPSTKGKEKEERPDVVDIEFPASIPNSKVSHNVSPEPRTAKLPNPSLPGNGSSSLQVAVKQSPDRAASDSSGALPAPDPDLSSGSQACLAYVPDLPRPSSPPPQLTRAVSWASIVRSRSRWTVEQERELARAEEQLTRCQKAWSSEQELWITYVQALSEEKEAHQGFMLMRTKQQEDERAQFRKAWKRRRSVEDAVQHKEKALVIRKNSNGLSKMRRAQHAYTSMASSNFKMDDMAVTKSPMLACQG
ncbi:hypothetical protein N7470_002394 [Penicillium chermesinum]|nr:hypothetical protein N7470_002394 [Penicillium chermesinum]